MYAARISWITFVHNISSWRLGQAILRRLRAVSGEERRAALAAMPEGTRKELTKHLKQEAVGPAMDHPGGHGVAGASFFRIAGASFFRIAHASFLFS